jgi:hypothetical protein
MSLLIRSIIPILIFLLLPVAAIAADKMIVTTGPPSVEMRLSDNFDDMHFRFQVEITHHGNGFTYETEFSAKGLADALTKQRNRTGWKDGRFFAWASCGGGNAWRCDREYVFRLEDDRLIYLGENVCPYWEDPKPGNSFKGGYYFDIYDKLQDCGYVCRGCAPHVKIVKHENQGRLVVDTQLTWLKNIPKFRENELRIQKAVWEKKRNNPPEPGYPYEAREILLFNATLAKYCSRPKELDEVQRAVSLLLDHDDWEAFQSVLDDVVPGEISDWQVPRGGIQPLLKQ